MTGAIGVGGMFTTMIIAGFLMRLSWWRSLRAWAKDRRGVAAIEFALIAPILFILYFMTMEVSQAIETNKKVGRISSMVADLITQQQEVNLDELSAIMDIGASIMRPYNRSQLSFQVTAIEVSNNGTPRVTWSRSQVGGNLQPGRAVGSTVDIPESQRTPGAHLIEVTSRLDYRPVIAWTAQQKASLGLVAAFDNIAMGETYRLRPRMATNGIACKDC